MYSWQSVHLRYNHYLSIVSDNGTGANQAIIWTNNALIYYCIN